jgi:hypothetical protein
LFDPGGARYYLTGSGNGIRVFDATSDAEIDTDGDSTNGVTPIAIAAGSNFYAHGLVITPF